MRQLKKARVTLITWILLFLLAFVASLVLQISLSQYQTTHVLRPLEQRTRNILDISQFLEDVETCMTALYDYRWDYGDAVSMIALLEDTLDASQARLEEIQTEITVVGESQYLLANAAKTTYRTMAETLEEIMVLLASGRSDEAAALYYAKAEPCGTYLRQYVQELLRQAIADNQEAYGALSTLNDRLSGAMTVVLLICMGLGCVVVYSTVRMLRFFQLMSRASQDISQGAFDTPDLDESRNDEIGHLAATFNEMKRSTKQQMRLLEENSEMERKLHKKEKEALEYQTLMERTKLQQLRSQINPHFLFNTLNVILYTAQQEGAVQTTSLLGSLSRLFRYALESNERQVSLAREVNILNEFFALYHSRFGDRVRIRWHISPQVDLADTMVPSFLLQPLVENAYQHGIGPKESGGCVDIYMETEGSLLRIRVADDGVGMDAKKLEVLRQCMESPSLPSAHIGIYNVAARLRLLGPGYSMDMQSEPGQGTTVNLVLPLVISGSEEDEADDEDTDCG